MKIIVDTNIAFSALLNPRSNIGNIILNSQDFFDFYTCEFLREEIQSHRSKILKISKYSEKEYEEVQSLLFKQFIFFSESNITLDYWKNAANLVRDVDIDDITFVTVSLFLDIKIWTGDKILIAGLHKKGFTNTITTDALLKIRNEQQ